MDAPRPATEAAGASGKRVEWSGCGMGLVGVAASILAALVSTISVLTPVDLVPSPGFLGMAGSLVAFLTLFATLLTTLFSAVLRIGRRRGTSELLAIKRTLRAYYSETLKESSMNPSKVGNRG